MTRAWRPVALALLFGACAGERERPAVPASTSPASTSPASTSPASTADLRAAERALAAYLEASRDGSTSAAALDTLLGCGARGALVLPITLLGAYRVLPASGAGDTLLGRAVVATVAEQRADRRRRGRYLARQRVAVDTLEWDVVRGGDGRWTVCNGLQFGFHPPEEATTWLPPGASRATARAAADSVHRTWGAGAR